MLANRIHHAAQKGPVALLYETSDLRTSADAGLDSAALGRSTFIRRSAGRLEKYIPAFAYSEKQICAVIVLATHTLVFRDNKIPAADPKTVNYRASAAAISKGKLNGYWHNAENKKLFLSAANQAGSLMALVAAVLYHCWRLKWSNRDVAEHFSISMNRVWRIIKCAVNAAQRLGFQTWPWRAPYVFRNGNKLKWTAARREQQAQAMRKFYRNPARRKMTSDATRRGMAKKKAARLSAAVESAAA
jgi:hypothetical protein